MRDLYVYQDQLFEVIHEFTYTGQPEEFELQPGTYLMMCYGARGGRHYAYTDSDKTHGGLSMGILDLSDTTTLYAVVGGDGGNNSSDKNVYGIGGYNGGADGGLSAKRGDEIWSAGCGGGGGTDVRLNIDPDTPVTMSMTLPAEYTAIECLRGNKTVGIDTGYTPNSNTTVEVDFYANTTFRTLNYMTLFGCDNNGPGTGDGSFWLSYTFQIYNANVGWAYMFYLPGSYRSLAIGTSAATYKPDPALFDRRVILSIEEDGATWHEYGSSTIYSSKNDHLGFAPINYSERTDYPIPTLGIFAGNKATGLAAPQWDAPTDATIYSFTISEDGSNVHKYIPVVKTENDVETPGMYDIITNTFFPYEQPVVNILSAPADTNITQDGITFNCVYGYYTISGTAETDTTYRFLLSETTYVPRGYDYNHDGSSLLFANQTVMPSGIAVKFGYVGDGTDTVYKTYNSSTVNRVSYVDTRMDGMYEHNVNFVEVTVTSGTVINFEMGLMIVHTNSGTGPFITHDYHKLDTRTFTWTIKHHKSLNSRIIVAGGGGGSYIMKLPNDTDTLRSKNNECASGGGTYGGNSFAISGYNVNVFPTQSTGAHFGRGQTAAWKPIVSNIAAWGAEGDGGGGGGWYGGYCNIGWPNNVRSAGCGGGGSGYVLTESSYKPAGYMTDYTIADYYFTHPFMEASRSDMAKVIVARKITTLQAGDIIHSICTGRPEKVKLLPGTYKLACNGGWGNSRDIGNESPGGRATGILNIDVSVDVYMVVGGNSAFCCTSDNLTSKNFWSGRYSTNTYNGGAQQATDNMQAACQASGGGTDIRLAIPQESPLITLEDSLNSRIIVAGGGGGSSVGRASSSYVSDRRGGSGGGESGTREERIISGRRVYGSPDPVAVGTDRDSNPQFTSSDPSELVVNGGFGYGGTGIGIRGGYGGSGGGGWFGGGGILPDGNTDDEAPGGGGSGYVLTESSYKPSGYDPDPKFYLSETTNVAGGTTDRTGMSSATIEIYNIANTKLIIEDSEGIKSYDSNTDTWVLIPNVETITTYIIDQYGIYNIPSETGIVGAYSIYILDESDEVAGISLKILPNSQTLYTNVNTPNIIDECTIDIDNADENLTYDITTKTLNRSTQQIKIVFDMDHIPNVDYKLYSIFTTSTKSSTIEPPLPRPSIHLDHVDLMKVGERDEMLSNQIPMKYTDYIDPTLADGTTTITKFYMVSSLEYNREIYTLMLVNETEKAVILSKFNLATKQHTMIFQLALTELGFNLESNPCIGNFLVDDNYCYITARYNSRAFKRVALVSPHTITTFQTDASDGGYAITASGKMFWLNDRQIIFQVKNGIVIFDTIKAEVDRRIKSSSALPVSDGYDSIMTDYHIFRGSGNSTIATTCFDLTTMSFVSFTNNFSGRPVYAYGDGKLYILQPVSGGSDQIHVYDDETLTFIRTISIPVTSLTPARMNYSNKVLYILMEGSSLLYMCKLNDDGTVDFRTLGLTLTIPAQSNAAQSPALFHIYPTTFKQYYFMPYYKLLTVNYGNAAKYNLGYKYQNVVYQTNNSSKNSFVYDDTLTFTDSYMKIGISDILLDAEEFDTKIKSVYNPREYKELIDISIERKEDNIHG